MPATMTSSEISAAILCCLIAATRDATLDPEGSSFGSPVPAVKSFLASSAEVVACGGAVSLWPTASPVFEVGRIRVADDSSMRDVSSMRSTPSTRQNLSVSSVSTRLHCGQRFIFYGCSLPESDAPQQVGVARVVAKSVIIRVEGDEDQHAGPSLEVSFEPGERLILLPEAGVHCCEINRWRLSSGVPLLQLSQNRSCL